MSDNKQFDLKWSEAKDNKVNEESCIFVPQGLKPITQRQFNLYNYFRFIEKIYLKNKFSRSLEIGCGRGTISMYLSKYLGMDVVATDYSKEAVALARKNFDSYEIKGIVEFADAFHLTYPDNSFDLTVSIGLAEHFEDCEGLFREQYRVLRPGGAMVSLNIPKKYSIQLLNSLHRFFIRKSGKKLKEDYFRSEDSPLDFKRKAQKVGFVDIEVLYVNSFPLFTPVSMRAEKRITAFYNWIYKVRGIFMEYPFSGSRLLSQAHFLVAYKPRGK